MSSDNRFDIFKHLTRRGRPGDKKAPGDKKRVSSTNDPDMQEVGGTQVLPTQKPHGSRGGVGIGSKQTVMTVLRRAAQLSGGRSIPDWNEMVNLTDEQVWDIASRAFGGEDNVRAIIDSLPTPGAGEHLRVDDVPSKLIIDTYQGSIEVTKPEENRGGGARTHRKSRTRIRQERAKLIDALRRRPKEEPAAGQEEQPQQEATEAPPTPIETPVATTVESRGEEDQLPQVAPIREDEEFVPEEAEPDVQEARSKKSARDVLLEKYRKNPATYNSLFIKIFSSLDEGIIKNNGPFNILMDWVARILRDFDSLPDIMDITRVVEGAARDFYEKSSRGEKLPKMRDFSSFTELAGFVDRSREDRELKTGEVNEDPDEHGRVLWRFDDGTEMVLLNFEGQRYMSDHMGNCTGWTGYHLTQVGGGSHGGLSNITPAMFIALRSAKNKTKYHAVVKFVGREGFDPLARREWSVDNDTGPWNGGERYEDGYWAISEVEAHGNLGSSKAVPPEYLDKIDQFLESPASPTRQVSPQQPYTRFELPNGTYEIRDSQGYVVEKTELSHLGILTKFWKDKSGRKWTTHTKVGLEEGVTVGKYTLVKEGWSSIDTDGSMRGHFRERGVVFKEFSDGTRIWYGGNRPSLDPDDPLAETIKDNELVLPNSNGQLVTISANDIGPDQALVSFPDGTVAYFNSVTNEIYSVEYGTELSPEKHIISVESAIQGATGASHDTALIIRDNLRPGNRMRVYGTTREVSHDLLWSHENEDNTPGTYGYEIGGYHTTHDEHGNLHSYQDQPSTQSNEETLYHNHGGLHNENGVARRSYGNSQGDEIFHYQNGLLHNPNGPASITRRNGSIITEYFINGVLARIGKDAGKPSRIRRRRSEKQYTWTNPTTGDREASFWFSRDYNNRWHLTKAVFSPVEGRRYTEEEIGVDIVRRLKEAGVAVGELSGYPDSDVLQFIPSNSTTATIEKRGILNSSGYSTDQTVLTIKRSRVVPDPVLGSRIVFINEELVLDKSKLPELTQLMDSQRGVPYSEIEEFFRNNLAGRGYSTTTLDEENPFDSSTGNLNFREYSIDGEPSTIEIYRVDEMRHTWPPEDPSRVGLPTRVTYDASGNLIREEWLDSVHGLSRTDGPAKITYNNLPATYDSAGQLVAGSRREEWYFNGVLSRIDNPAVEEYDPDGNLVRQEWHMWWPPHPEGSVIYNPNGPAIVSYRKDGGYKEEWYDQFGNRKRKGGGPDIVVYHPNGRVAKETWTSREYDKDNTKPTTITYHTDGTIISKLWETRTLGSAKVLHRLDGPAEIFYRLDDSNSVLSKRYYVEGKKHREDGPALIDYDSKGNVRVEEHYIDGILHRSELSIVGPGPARITYSPEGNVTSHLWVRAGKPSRNQDLPTYVRYFENGDVSEESYPLSVQVGVPWGNTGAFFQQGQPSIIRYHANGRVSERIITAENGLPASPVNADNPNQYDPAIIKYDEDGNITLVEYYDPVTNKLHNLNGRPARVETDSFGRKIEKNFNQGELHSFKGEPAIIEYWATRDGTQRVLFKAYYKDGLRHRTEGPAEVRFNHFNQKKREEKFYVDGELHREDGPAVIYYDNNEDIETSEYWVNGVQVDSLNEPFVEENPEPDVQESRSSARPSYMPGDLVRDKRTGKVGLVLSVHTKREKPYSVSFDITSFDDWVGVIGRSEFTENDIDLVRSGNLRDSVSDIGNEVEIDFALGSKNIVGKVVGYSFDKKSKKLHHLVTTVAGFKTAFSGAKVQDFGKKGAMPAFPNLEHMFDTWLKTVVGVSSIKYEYVRDSWGNEAIIAATDKRFLVDGDNLLEVQAVYTLIPETGDILVSRLVLTHFKDGSTKTSIDELGTLQYLSWRTRSEPLPENGDFTIVYAEYQLSPGEDRPTVLFFVERNGEDLGIFSNIADAYEEIFNVMSSEGVYPPVWLYDDLGLNVDAEWLRFISRRERITAVRDYEDLTDFTLPWGEDGENYFRNSNPDESRAYPGTARTNRRLPSVLSGSELEIGVLTSEKEKLRANGEYVFKINVPLDSLRDADGRVVEMDEELLKEINSGIHNRLLAELAAGNYFPIITEEQPDGTHIVIQGLLAAKIARYFRRDIRVYALRPERPTPTSKEEAIQENFEKFEEVFVTGSGTWRRLLELNDQHKSNYYKAEVQRRRMLAETPVVGGQEEFQRILSEIMNSEWFKEAYPDMPELSLLLKSLEDPELYGNIIAGTNEIIINSNHLSGLQTLETLIHELAHAVTNKGGALVEAHGAEFAANHLFLLRNILGDRVADAQERSLRDKGVPIAERHGFWDPIDTEKAYLAVILPKLLAASNAYRKLEHEAIVYRRRGDFQAAAKATQDAKQAKLKFEQLRDEVIKRSRNWDPSVQVPAEGENKNYDQLLDTVDFLESAIGKKDTVFAVSKSIADLNTFIAQQKNAGAEKEIIDALEFLKKMRESGGIDAGILTARDRRTYKKGEEPRAIDILEGDIGGDSCSIGTDKAESDWCNPSAREARLKENLKLLGLPEDLSSKEGEARLLRGAQEFLSSDRHDIIPESVSVEVVGPAPDVFPNRAQYAINFRTRAKLDGIEDSSGYSYSKDTGTDSVGKVYSNNTSGKRDDAFANLLKGLGINDIYYKDSNGDLQPLDLESKIDIESAVRTTIYDGNGNRLLFRGMSWEGMQSLRDSGELRTNTSRALAGQEGLLFTHPHLSVAEYYAKYQPGKDPAFNKPSYIVVLRDTGTGHEKNDGSWAGEVLGRLGSDASEVAFSSSLGKETVIGALEVHPATVTEYANARIFVATEAGKVIDAAFGVYGPSVMDSVWDLDLLPEHLKGTMMVIAVGGSHNDGELVMTPVSHDEIFVPETPEADVQESRGVDYDPTPGGLNNRIFYHGTSVGTLSDTNLDSTGTNIMNLFGQGIYLTDSLEIAESYANIKAQKNKGRGYIYSIELNVRNTIDMDGPANKDFYEVLRGFTERFYGIGSKELDEAMLDPNTTNTRLYNIFVEALEDYSYEDSISADELTYEFQELASLLRERGYDALTHVGGLRAGGGEKLHQVAIILDPSNSGAMVDHKSVNKVRLLSRDEWPSSQEENFTPETPQADVDESRGTGDNAETTYGLPENFTITASTRPNPPYSDHVIYRAYDGDQEIGSLVIVEGGIIVNNKERPRMIATNINVNKDYRRRGIAASLLRQAEKDLGHIYPPEPWEMTQAGISLWLGLENIRELFNSAGHLSDDEWKDLMALPPELRSAAIQKLITMRELFNSAGHLNDTEWMELMALPPELRSAALEEISAFILEELDNPYILEELDNPYFPDEEGFTPETPEPDVDESRSGPEVTTEGVLDAPEDLELVDKGERFKVGLEDSAGVCSLESLNKKLSDSCGKFVSKVLKAAGLTDPVTVTSTFAAQKIVSDRFDLELIKSSGDTDYFGNKERHTLSVIEKHPDNYEVGYDGLFRKSLVLYDPDFIELTPDEDIEGGINTTVKSSLPRGYTRNLSDVVSNTDGLIFRGMSFEEYNSARSSGLVQSNGLHNIGEKEIGLTFYTPNIITAESYANGFAPTQHKPTPLKPAYIVAIRMPDNALTPENSDRVPADEVAIEGAVSFSEVQQVIEVQPVTVRPVEWELVRDRDQRSENEHLYSLSENRGSNIVVYRNVTGQETQGELDNPYFPDEEGFTPETPEPDVDESRSGYGEPQFGDYIVEARVEGLGPYAKTVYDVFRFIRTGLMVSKWGKANSLSDISRIIQEPNKLDDVYGGRGGKIWLSSVDGFTDITRALSRSSKEEGFTPETPEPDVDESRGTSNEPERGNSAYGLYWNPERLEMVPLGAEDPMNGIPIIDSQGEEVRRGDSVFWTEYKWDTTKYRVIQTYLSDGKPFVAVRDMDSTVATDAHPILIPASYITKIPEIPESWSDDGFTPEEPTPDVDESRDSDEIQLDKQDPMELSDDIQEKNRFQWGSLLERANNLEASLNENDKYTNKTYPYRIPDDLVPSISQYQARWYVERLKTILKNIREFRSELTYELYNELKKVLDYLEDLYGHLRDITANDFIAGLVEVGVDENDAWEIHSNNSLFLSLLDDIRLQVNQLDDDNVLGRRRSAVNKIESLANSSVLITTPSDELPESEKSDAVQSALTYSGGEAELDDTTGLVEHVSGGMNGHMVVNTVRDPDGNIVVKYISKSVSDQGGFSEAVGIEVAELFGLGHLVPQAALVGDDGINPNARMFGVPQVANDKTNIEIVPGRPLKHHQVDSSYETVLLARYYYYKSLGMGDAEASRRAMIDAQKLTLLDTLLMTGDRANGGNILYDPITGKLTVIDFGYIFSKFVELDEDDDLKLAQAVIDSNYADNGRIRGWDFTNMLPEVREALQQISGSDIISIVDDLKEDIDWAGLVEDSYDNFLVENLYRIEDVVNAIKNILLRKK